MLLKLSIPVTCHSSLEVEIYECKSTNINVFLIHTSMLTSNAELQVNGMIFNSYCQCQYLSESFRTDLRQSRCSIVKFAPVITQNEIFSIKDCLNQFHFKQLARRISAFLFGLDSEQNKLSTNMANHQWPFVSLKLKQNIKCWEIHNQDNQKL